jgi:hypothetical protein
MSAGLYFGAGLDALGDEEFKSLGDGDDELAGSDESDVDLRSFASPDAAAAAASGAGNAELPTIELKRAAGPRGPYRRGTKAKQALRDAAAKVDAKELTVPEAAAAFNVPEQSLRDHMRCGGVRRPPGRPPSNEFVETLLVKWMIICASLGWPQTKHTILLKAAQLAAANGTPFKGPEGIPSENWWPAFKSRHRDAFRMRTANRRRYAQAAAATRENLDAFYKLLGDKIAELKLDASRIWNADETGLDRLGAGKGQVAVPSAVKQPEVLQSDWKEHVSIMTAIRADGKACAHVHFQGHRGRAAQEALPAGHRRAVHRARGTDRCVPAHTFACFAVRTDLPIRSIVA